MTAPPLSHHDILARAGPFARAGWQVDLAACDRAARRIVFRPREIAQPEVRLRETLQLDCHSGGSHRLTRTLHGEDGLAASVQCSGRDTAALLAAVAAVPPARGFAGGHGWRLALHHEVAGGTLALRRAELRAAGLLLAMTVPAARRAPAELKLSALGHERRELAELPEDLLALLGWNWARLIRRPGHWMSRLRLRGDAVRRGERAEAALQRAGEHLVATFAAPPSAYHERHRAARWGVFFRRAIPLLTPLALALTVIGLPRFDVGAHPGPWLLLYHVPTMLIALSFCLQELPALEIPPWPRPLAAPDWHAPAPAAGGIGPQAAGR